MKDKVVARRYAEGFLSHAKDTIGLERGFEELTKIRKIISENPDLKKFLENLEITHAEKSGVIDEVFKEGFCDESKEFLKFLIRKGRVEHILEIADYAKVIYYRERGLEKAVLKSVKPLDKATIKTIKDRLERKLRKKLELEVKLDPALIGGLQATIGNIVIDGSVKRMLAELKENLTAIKVH